MYYAIIYDIRINASDTFNPVKNFAHKQMNVDISSNVANILDISLVNLTNSINNYISFTDSYNYEHSVSHLISNNLKYLVIDDTKYSSKLGGISNIFFPKYADNQDTTLYNGEISFQGAMLFKVDNYSKNRKIDFSIKYTGTIFKDGAFGVENYSFSKTINHEYTLN